MKKKFLSTGQIAKKYSVTPDTVLKWIKNGKLSAQQTQGGHYRIDEVDVENQNFLELKKKNTIPNKAIPHKNIYCWEFMSDSDKINSKCKECIVFQSKTKKCYELVKLGTEIGHKKIYCENRNCKECKYFLNLQKISPNILVISDDKSLKEFLTQNIDTNKINLHISENEIESLVIMQYFIPNYVLVDYSLISRKVIKSLTNKENL